MFLWFLSFSHANIGKYLIQKATNPLLPFIFNSLWLHFPVINSLRWTDYIIRRSSTSINESCKRGSGLRASMGCPCRKQMRQTYGRAGRPQALLKARTVSQCSPVIWERVNPIWNSDIPCVSDSKYSGISTLQCICRVNGWYGTSLKRDARLGASRRWRFMVPSYSPWRKGQHGTPKRWRLRSNIR